MSDTAIVSQQLKRMKEQLLDLSFRSPFLNFKQNEKRTVRIVQESPAELLRLLYEEQTTMKLECWAEGKGAVPGISPFESLDSQPLEDHHTDKSIQTSVLSEEKLNTLLKNLGRDATDALEEKGINLLHLGLGMLQYPVKVPGGEEKQYQAPLLLLPVQLENSSRSKTGKPIWTLSATGDDVAINLTLCKKLASDFNLYLPENFDDTLSLYEGCLDWLRTVSSRVKSQAGFRVITDCHLGFFNFQKYALFKDMETYEELYLNHPVTQAICDPNQFHIKQQQMINFQSYGEQSLDTIFPPESAFHVLDADSSQLESIYRVQEGHHLIIEGPPGTGKSQTIANIIANALGSGKRVLFVSEKGAAVQVVYDRLQRLGLSTYCLDLHSIKANRKAVMNELQEAFDKQLKNEVNQFELIKRKLPEVRSQLSRYAESLHQPIEPLSITLFEGIGKFNQLNAYSRPMIRLSNIHNTSKIELEKHLEALEHLERILSLIKKPSEHPWFLAQKTAFSSFEKEELKIKLLEVTKLLQEITEKLEQYSSQLGVKSATCLGDIATFGDVIGTLLDSPSSENSVLTNEHWNHVPSSVTWLLQTGKQFESVRRQLDIFFENEWFDQPTGVFDEWKETLQAHQKLSLLRYLTPKYYQDLKAIRQFLNPNSQKLDLDSLLKNIHKTIQYAELRKELQQQDAQASALFGFHWKGLATDWKRLEQFTGWITQFRQFALQEYFDEKAFEVASQGKLSSEEWQPKLTSLLESSQVVHQKLNELVKILDLKSEQTLISLSVPLTQLAQQTKIWLEALPELETWTNYLEAKTACLSMPFLATYLLESNIEETNANTLVKSFEALFYHQWVDKVVTEQEGFRKFSTTQHQEWQQQFQKLDKEVTDSTRSELLSRLQNIKNKAFVQADERLRTYLQTQIRKSRQGESIRSMFRKSSELILYLKPCLMMSPLSVAEFIDPSKLQFDLVIFDEASQVKPSEALASIIRAKQAIVVGDSKQLPPTNFFSKQIEGSESEVENEDAESVIDNKIEESILDQCYKAGFKSCMLKWHYRSKHESLIAFSNHKFYQDLYTFPSAENELYGLKYHYIPEGVYEGEGKNTIEARAIVDEICRHAQHHPHLSLGVATFGMKQRTLILDLIDERKSRDAVLTRFLESHPHERFFVKNLENVQGDERDIMIISVTYGRSHDGKLKMNFGPVNGEQGWRRLNVIATRSRYSMKVFASFRADELDPTRLNNSGARYFREFLFFADKKKFSSETTVEALTDFDSPFEESVYDALTQQGYKCVTQVGQSGYRIDIGILDTEVEGLFVAGVECDGAQYHSSQCARDRDRLRQSVLESLGWTIIRVWSTAWFKNPEGELQRLVSEIEQAKVKTHQRRNQEIQQELDQKNWEFEDESNEEDSCNVETSIELPLYERYNPQVFGQPQQLEIDKTFFKVVMAILEVESPIHIDELTRLTIAHWNVTRISDRTRDMVRRALSALNEMNEPVCLKEPFVYHNAKSIQPRNRKPLKPFPKFDLIADEEIEETIKLLLASEPILPEMQLAQKVAKLLGYDRTTTLIKERIVNVIQRMLAQASLAHASFGVQLAL
jgi:very-short-patch-repair endonuclease